MGHPSGMDGRYPAGSSPTAGDDHSCDCVRRGPVAQRAATTFLGVDETAGRFADVEVVDCAACGRTWLVYRWEVEGIPRSGRWYAGVVSPDVVTRVAPEAAPHVLESLAWHLCGGTYFGGAVSRRAGRLLGS